MNTARHRHAEAGFTLFEMLIALVLTVGILGALATITAQWLPNWDRGLAHVQRTEVFALGLERLVADLSAAEFMTANRKSKLPLFDGDELAVRFVRTAIGPNMRPGLEVVSVSTLSDDRGIALVRARAPFAPLPENAKLRDLSSFVDPVVLIRAPYRAIFSYAGPDQRGAKAGTTRSVASRHSRVGARRRDAAHAGGFDGGGAACRRAAVCAAAKVIKDCLYPAANAAPRF